MQAPAFRVWQGSGAPRRSGHAEHGMAPGAGDIAGMLATPARGGCGLRGQRMGAGEQARSEVERRSVDFVPGLTR